ncbi:type I-F CRISPR-associated helicase Cas3f [Photobacterium sanguinicancri]|uniref:Type I-F CRISPR-associated helicase Cas3 n=1 Tax=Photobacterium sanguinicancri TaxID=875932 RepID=A0ABX4G1W7_9GAMM|nr:type I-F CRISPR-associated helicase Cas3f [Photobacterium sanguinicancri]OZS45032.1 type I-F CRISPR-associated helicase Cas3 [Photobacterium sanguinicancri]OZS45500.1 type I-F CRISPR-associated helicase Cas3 [Photobacterium sanguinicancri]
MNILLVSECSKQALPETRRVLDQFAERKGRRTWQTPITYEGLKTLRQLLKKTARRNTAVACHWVRGKNHTELMWVVGNRRKFNLDGSVPTNTTQRDILRSQDENNMNSIQTSALMAGIAALFHDFGKGNKLFQQKLKPKSKSKGFEPYRHEWLSCQLFIGFVAGRTDQEWLEHLGSVSENDDKPLIEGCDPTQSVSFTDLSQSPLAQCIVWLILSHHRLPKCLGDGPKQDLNDVDSWLTGFGANWNALNHCIDKFTPAERVAVTVFPHGTPMRSYKWRSKAKELSKRALNQANLAEYASLDKAFPLHIARMALMLADHAYSSGEPNTYWQDEGYNANANTYRETGKPKQQLDEHCVGVAHNAYILARTMPKLRGVMPAITNHKGFKRRSKISKFRWQDKAYDCAYSIAEQTEQQGFFGVNMASTGQGKTFANARIMYGLSNPTIGCRFSVALGLRTLTLQTGDALQQRLNLDTDDLAVHIGSQAVKELFYKQKQQEELEKLERASEGGSESEQIFAEHEYVRYDGEIDNQYLHRWLENKGAVHKLVSAPISVSTIDHIIPVSEGVTGGQQIAPMLRLLTSDLVLDEPDDFSLEDDPALARLVYFSGLLGSRVLLSSATLPPALVTHLFACYQSGRAQYNQVIGQQVAMPVSCAWFDEFGVKSSSAGGIAEFRASHDEFTKLRAEKLTKHSEHLHKGDWLKIAEVKLPPHQVIETFAKTVYQGITQLAVDHKTVSELQGSKGKTVSAGIVRMANIEPLVAVAKHLLATPPPENTRIHYCIYHSQHPLAVRSAIEQQLDGLLQRDRDDLQGIIKTPVVEAALNQYPEQHHIFVVLATPVAEVGRDHDYDWAVVEPSSMRSIIQLAGRVQRHRRIEPRSTNILVLNQNVKALKGEDKAAYSKPGFESKQTFRLSKNGPKTPCLQLSSHDLCLQMEASNLHKISSSPRFVEPDRSQLFVNKQVGGFIELEHLAMNLKLRDTVKPWYSNSKAHLFAEFQKQTPFRQSNPSIDYVCMLNELDEEPVFKQWDRVSNELIDSSGFAPFGELLVADSNSIWGAAELPEVIEQLSEWHDTELQETCIQFASVSLRAPCENELGKQWLYHPVLGIFEGKDMS